MTDEIDWAQILIAILVASVAGWRAGDPVWVGLFLSSSILVFVRAIVTGYERVLIGAFSLISISAGVHWILSGDYIIGSGFVFLAMIAIVKLPSDDSD